MNYKQSEKQIREILQRYMHGECTEQEATLLEQWFELASLEKTGGPSLNEEDEERLVGALRKAMMGRESDADNTSTARVVKMRKIFRHAAVWAGLILLAGGAVVLLRRRTPVRQEVAFTEMVTGYGEVRKILLPDSSVVWLNSATHLGIHPDFIRHRELRLSGEAFFDVAPDVHHPFIVRSGNASTQVLGTAFNISAYAATGQLRISLQSGKIGVIYDGKTGKSEKILTPGQLFIFDKESGVGQIERQSPGEMDVWTAGRLLFYKTPLKEALSQIEARYGVPIVCDRPLKDQTITAKFENTALEKVLEHLSFGWDLHFTRKGDTLHVR